MPRERTTGVTLMATVLTLSLVASVTALGIGIAGANHPDDAPDLTDEADFRVNFPNPSDHYPGNVNEESGSIQYFASGADAFAVQDAEDGVYIDWIIVHAEYDGEDWIDYSACDVPNTESFGIDRGNDNEGTQYDEDLVSRQEQSWFRDDGIIIDFYDWEDIGNDPPYMAPEDAIVAAQGEGSTDGPCLTLTSEPGWYRIAAYMNGTVADNGPDAQPSENADRVSLELNSNYLYVCECDSEEEARDELGDPPDERSGGDPTPTETESGDDPTPTETESGDDPTPTETEPGTENGEGTQTTEPGTQDGNTGEETQSTQSQQNDGGGVGTPTVDEAPGFGPVVALLALLAGALIARRRG